MPTLTTVDPANGKPIAQSRNELKGLAGRPDFLLGQTARTLRPRRNP